MIFGRRLQVVFCPKEDHAIPPSRSSVMVGFVPGASGSLSPFRSVLVPSWSPFYGLGDGRSGSVELVASLLSDVVPWLVRVILS